MCERENEKREGGGREFLAPDGMCVCEREKETEKKEGGGRELLASGGVCVREKEN